MSPTNRQRAAMLNQMNGFCNVRRLMKDLNLSARQLADTALAIQATLADACLGGPAQFTGNNRVFANGAVASEVRCRKCHKTFWITAVPHALCPDCDEEDSGHKGGIRRITELLPPITH